MVFVELPFGVGFEAIEAGGANVVDELLSTAFSIKEGEFSILCDATVIRNGLKDKVGIQDRLPGCPEIPIAISAVKVIAVNFVKLPAIRCPQALQAEGMV